MHIENEGMEFHGGSSLAFTDQSIYKGDPTIDKKYTVQIDIKNKPQKYKRNRHIPHKAGYLQDASKLMIEGVEMEILDSKRKEPSKSVVNNET